MSKYDVSRLWKQSFGSREEAYDYAGRLMKKSACGNQKSAFCPTIDHIRPLSGGGHDVAENLVICHRDTNAEKADCFPHWKANGKSFYAKRIKGSRVGYKIFKALK